MVMPTDLATITTDSEEHSEFALVTWDQTIYYARVASLRAQVPLETPVTRLIEGLYESQPQFARKILRNRIFTNARLTEFCQGMIRVAAKRYSISADIHHSLSSTSRRWVEVSNFSKSLMNSSKLETILNSRSSPLTSHSEFIQAALLMRDQTPHINQARYLLDRKVAALLVSNEGKILTSAINSNSTHKTHHAEINLIRDYCARNQKKLPVGARIYTTLKPCKMCAGMIWEHAEDLKKIAVYFFENDLGSFARSTVLNPGSFERNRATLDPLLRKIQLEWQIGI